MWDLIVSVPDHCLSFYFTLESSLVFCLSKFINFLKVFVTALILCNASLSMIVKSLAVAHLA